MGALIDIVLPVFGVALLGFGAGRFKLMSEAAVDGLAGFVYYVATPALLIRALATTRALEVANLDVLWAYFSGTLIVFFASWLFGLRVFKFSDGSEGALAMASVFGNTVLLGIPIVYTAFGDAGLIHLMLIITCHSAILMPLSITAIEIGRASGKGFWHTALGTLRLLMRNPVLISAVIGVAYGFSGLAIPQGLDRFLTLLGGASVPCALFALGASLAGFKLGGVLGHAATASALKLIAHPLLVGFFAFAVFDLDPVAAAVVLITAALPTGVNAFIVAQQHQVFIARSASIVLITTVLAIPLLAAILTWLRVGG